MIPTSGWLWLALITTALIGACVAQRSEAISATAEAPAAPNLTMPAAPSATPTPEPIVLAAGRPSGEPAGDVPRRPHHDGAGRPEPAIPRRRQRAADGAHGPRDRRPRAGVPRGCGARPS